MVRGCKQGSRLCACMCVEGVGRVRGEEVCDICDGMYQALYPTTDTI